MKGKAKKYLNTFLFLLLFIEIGYSQWGWWGNDPNFVRARWRSSINDISDTFPDKDLYLDDTLTVMGKDTLLLPLFIFKKGYLKGDGGNNDTLVILSKIKNEPWHWIDNSLVIKFDSLGRSSDMYFENWGAKGDGSTDDSTAFYRALDQADGLRVLGVEKKTYRIENSAYLQIQKREINIGSTGKNFTIKPDSQLFSLESDVSISTTSMTGNYKPGTDTILVSESSNISIDNLIAIRSDEQWDFDGANTIKHEILKVKRISSGSGGDDDTLWVQPAIVDEYTNETVTIRIYNARKLQLRNFTVEYPENSNVKAIEAYYFSPVQIENLNFKNCERTGIQLFDCMDGYIRGCNGEYIDGVGLGYMIYIDGSADIDVGPGNQIYHGRGGLVDGGGRVARRIRVFRNNLFNLQGSTNRVAGNHQGSEHWVWENNIFADCNIGVLIRGEQNYILNNTFFNVTTPIAINGGGSIYVKNNNVFSNHSWRGGIGIDYSDNLALHIVSISNNVDQTRDSKYVIENNFGEVQQCIVDASIGDTLYNLVVKNNTLYGDYSLGNNGFFQVIGSSGTHFVDADVRFNNIIAPDTLKEFVSVFNTAVTFDTSKIKLDWLFYEDKTFFNQSRLKFKNIQQYWDKTNSIYRWDTPSGDSTLVQSFSDSLQDALANNSTFESNIINWGSKLGTNSHETVDPLVGIGSIKIVSTSENSGSIIDTAQTLLPNTTYSLSGVLKLTVGTSNKDIRVSMFQKQSGNNFVKQLPIKRLGKATLNTKVTFTGEFITPSDAAYTHYGVQVDDLNTTFIADSIFIHKKEFYGLETRIVGATTLDSVSFSGGGPHQSAWDTTHAGDTIRVKLGGKFYKLEAIPD